MADLDAMKAHAARTIDAHAGELEEIGRRIFANPELGFKEKRTASVVHEAFDRMGLAHRDGLAITGSRADIIGGGGDGPTVAIIGELDSLLCWEHPDRDPATGAVHACGHNAQIATMLGAGMALREAAADLAGRIVLFAVPAEEYVEIEERLALRSSGALEFLGGKAELVRLGLFDDIDIAMMVHTEADPENGLLSVAGSNNGMIAKFVRYIGRASHAGGSPHKGVNALYAAEIAMAGINALRETFRDDDHVRVHPIITRGGDVVNAIPADVRLELFCRGARIEAILDAHEKVERALKAGALALGADVEITTLAGYLPLGHDPNLVALFRANAERIVGPERVTTRGHGGGSTDMGDLAHLMPAVHPYARGATGAGHGADYVIADYNAAVLNPAKALAFTAIDLLADGGREAKRVKAEFTPKLTKDAYLDYQRRMSTTRRWSPRELE